MLCEILYCMYMLYDICAQVYVEAENTLRGNVEFYYIVARRLYLQVAS